MKRIELEDFANPGTGIELHFAKPLPLTACSW
jgi:hypothetical protein